MTILFALFLTTLQVRQHPASAAVGDPITLQYQVPPGAKVTLRPSPDFEVVTSGANSFVIRAFQTGDFTPEGAVSEPAQETRRLRGPRVTIRSVLARNDQLKPAPLLPPLPLPSNRTADVALAVAAVVTLAAWAAVIVLARRKTSGTLTRMLAPDEEFLQTLRSLRQSVDGPPLLIALADASRRYLSRVDDRLGRELTTFELLRHSAEVLPDEALSALRNILSQADLAKFSPWGSPLSAFHPFIDEASGIVLPQPEEPAA